MTYPRNEDGKNQGLDFSCHAISEYILKIFSWPVFLTFIVLMTGSNVFAQPDIAGSDWSGYFRTTGLDNLRSITATVYQNGGRVQIITSKSGLGRYLVGSINSSGHMLVYDQYDGEDWTTHYGPANSFEIALYDYICPTCSQLNVIYLTRPDPNDIDNDGDGYSENQGDCNDTKSTIYPFAIDVCGDDIDQDCDGKDQLCANTSPIIILLLGDE